MAVVSQLYPPNPDHIPPDLTRPSRSYRFRVVIVLVCLFVFLGVYLALTVGSAYLCYACFTSVFDDRPPARSGPTYNSRSRTYTPPPSPRSSSRYPDVMLIAGGVSSGLLCLFLVKGLFKRSGGDGGVRVEVTEKDQPVLFGFIRQLCRDTRAPFPHRVYLVPDVNAAVAYHESFLNLFLPARKNLIIGLGLVNRLNLTEFKAVLAHEFGHFSQNSMKLGSYVYTANRVVVDVVFRRDALDDFVAMLRRLDVRIAVFAWVFSAVLWVMRKGLEGMFRGINFANSSLSRQMEYNADLVAVSVTGSDALIFALGRLDFASETLGQAWADLSAAADHGRFSRDLYYHQTQAAKYLRARNNDPSLGEVPALPADPEQTVRVFKPEDTSVPKMWATHPANHDREVNAKARYVRGPVDDRPAWELFEQPAAVREAVTRRVYETARSEKPDRLEDPAEVQAFIDAEHAETTYHSRYHGLYDNRYVRPGSLDELLSRDVWGVFADRERLAESAARLYGDELAERMAAHKGRQEEVDRLARLAGGAVALAGKDFEHRGNRYRLADATRLLNQVQEEVDKDFEWMHLLDRQAFLIHYAMANDLGESEKAELEERYRFHLALQDLHGILAAHNHHAQATRNALAGQRQVPQEQFQGALNALREAHDTVSQQLHAAGRLRLPALTNVTAGTPLGPFLLTQPLVRNLSSDTTTLDGAWIQQFFGQLGEILEKTKRTLFKSLGGILALQERIAERWAAAHVPPVPGASVEEEPTP